MRPGNELAAAARPRRRRGRRGRGLHRRSTRPRARVPASPASTMQFHGDADRRALGGAPSRWPRSSQREHSAGAPAVTLRSVGGAGGQAAAFTYDLARSVVYTRQGNPAWAGVERDGQAGPIRSNDLFFPELRRPQQGRDPAGGRAAASAGEPHHPDEPRPDAAAPLLVPAARPKAAVVMTGDDHADGGTDGHSTASRRASPSGCSVADWECVRATSYVYPGTTIDHPGDARLSSEGFEIALHLNTGCADFTPGLDRTTGATSSPSSSCDSPGSPAADQPDALHRLERLGERGEGGAARTASASTRTTTTGLGRGSRTALESSPVRGSRSGSPTLDGSMIDVYQATTQLTDESGQRHPAFTSRP